MFILYSVSDNKRRNRTWRNLDIFMPTYDKEPIEIVIELPDLSIYLYDTQVAH
jgi:hypothetical protein